MNETRAVRMGLDEYLTRKQKIAYRRIKQRTTKATYTPSKWRDRSKYNGDGSLKI